MDYQRTSNSKLKVGIVAEDYYLLAWQCKILEKLVEDSLCEIVIIIEKNTPRITKDQYEITLNYTKNFLYRAYRIYDQKRFKCKPDALKFKDIRKEFPDHDFGILHADSDNNDILNQETINRINNLKFDLFINFNSEVLQKNPLNIPSFGIWEIKFGDTKKFKGDPDGFWEVIEKWDETCISLQIRINHIQNVYTLYESFSLTDLDSVHKNLNRSYWKAVSFIPDKIKEISEFGEEYFFNLIEKVSNYNVFSEKIRKIPSNLEMFLIFIRIFIDKVKYRINHTFYFYQWSLLFNISNSHSNDISLCDFEKIHPPKDRFWADPHLIKNNNKYYIFIEEFPFKEKKGFISCFEMDSEGRYTDPIKVLERDYHLSYPFVFEDNGNTYMIPETKTNNTIELYKCTEFPYKWELAKVLMNNIAAVDATVFYLENKYWLFANIVRNEGASSFDDLFIFSSPTLISNNWESHPKNPIISDVKRSRPAGKIFSYNNKIYRPSQNCSKLYGYGMKMNQIIELNDTNYNEKEVYSINPNWDQSIIATHTFNYCDNLTIIDGLIKRPKI